MKCNIFTGDGYYDKEGNWQRLKFCFTYCGERCICRPPNGIYKIKSKKEESIDPKPIQNDI